jgi:hypothetical protein
MSVPEEPASFLSRYATKGALIYYALVLPAIVLEVVFSIATATTPGGLVSQAAAYGPAVSAATQLLPWVIIIASLYAVFSFRPSVLVTLLVASFFVAVSVANEVTIFGARLNLEASVILVVFSTFLALVGFNYARGLKLLGGRRPDITSSGPLGYGLLGLALESAVPVAAAVALVLLVEAVVSALVVQSALLPPPLSTLASLYLNARIGLVFTTLFVAGAMIWVLRQFLEPVILHFTLSGVDARKELLSEIEPTTKSVRKVMRYRPSRGLAWGILAVAYCAGIFAVLAYFLPRGQLSRDFLAGLDLHAPPPNPFELLLQNSMKNALVRVDILFAQSQDYIREVIRLLWG